jgi:hypothetical protein
MESQSCTFESSAIHPCQKEHISATLKVSGFILVYGHTRKLEFKEVFHFPITFVFD